MAEYSKGDFAKQLGISRGELESRAKSAGFDTTEAYYRSGMWQGNVEEQVPSTLEFASGLETGISDSLKQLVLAQKGQRKPLDVYTELEEAKGIPEKRKVAQTLREQVYDIEDTIKRVEPTIKATTRESMVTEGQRERMEVTQKKPLLERLTELTRDLGRIDESIAADMQDLGTKVSLFMRGQEMDLEPLKIQYQATVDKATRLISAFSVDAQNKFNLYLARLRRGWDLEDREREEAFALLQSENEYKQLLETTAAGAGIKLSGRESNDDILELIGQAAAEEIEFERYVKPFQKTGTDTTSPFAGWPWQTPWNTEGSDWVIVGSEYKQGLQSPQMSAAPGTITTTRLPTGQTVYWTMGSDGRWK